MIFPTTTAGSKTEGTERIATAGGVGGVSLVEKAETLMRFVRSMHEQTKKTTNNATKGLYMYGS